MYVQGKDNGKLHVTTTLAITSIRMGKKLLIGILQKEQHVKSLKESTNFIMIMFEEIGTLVNFALTASVLNKTNSLPCYDYRPYCHIWVAYKFFSLHISHINVNFS